MTWGMVFGAVLIIAATLVAASVIVQLFRMLVDYYVARRSKDLIAKLVEVEERCDLAERQYYYCLKTAAEYKKKYDKVLKLAAEQQIHTRPAPPQFSAEEIKRLVRLCHPDRHNNSEASVKMTQKLMNLRNS